MGTGEVRRSKKQQREEKNRFEYRDSRGKYHHAELEEEKKIGKSKWKEAEAKRDKHYHPHEVVCPDQTDQDPSGQPSSGKWLRRNDCSNIHPILTPCSEAF
jgi:hypothetical protein